METQLLDYVSVYDNILPQNFCDHLIQLIKNSWDKEVISNDGKPNFTQLNVNQHDPDLVSALVQYALLTANKYAEDHPNYKHFTGSVSGMEEFRVKCYNGGTDDRFDNHVDVGDLTSCKRYLAMLFYLNDDFTGGETCFTKWNGSDYVDDYVIIPKAGSVMVFPPMWMFPHRGAPVLEGAKFIMSTYLNYT